MQSMIDGMLPNMSQYMRENIPRGMASKMLYAMVHCMLAVMHACMLSGISRYKMALCEDILNSLDIASAAVVGC